MEIDGEVRVHEDPDGPLSRLAQAMFDVIHQHEQPYVKAIVMLVDLDPSIAEHEAVVAHHGYETGDEAFMDMLVHVRAIGSATGHHILIGGVNFG